MIGRLTHNKNILAAQLDASLHAPYVAGLTCITALLADPGRGACLHSTAGAKQWR